MKFSAHTTFIFIYLFILFLKSGVSFSQEMETSQPTEGTETFLNGKWELTMIDNEAVTASSFSNGLPFIEINIKERMVNGNTGCNTFSGKVTSEGEKIKFENILATEMACQYQRDGEFFDALQNCNNYFIDNGILSLKSDEAVRAVFQKIEGAGSIIRDSVKQIMFDKGIGFFASGHEPPWTVEFTGAESLLFNLNTGIEVINFKVIETINDLRDDSITILAEGDGDDIIVRILKRECTDLMSGKKFPYEIKLNFDDMLYIGCGDFTTERDSSGTYRINDIWVLERLGDEELNKSDFKTGMPMIEINIKENSFMGNTGCNKMNGSMKNVGSLIFFSKIASTRMMCPGGYDSRIFSALKESDNFEIENMKLYLKSGDKVLAVWQKID